MPRKSKKATETTVESSSASAPKVAATASPSTPAPSSSSPMKFTMRRKDLAAHVRRLASIADKKATLKVLSFIAMRASARGVLLAATDLDVYGIVEDSCASDRGSAACTVESYGGFALPAKDFGDVLRKLPDGMVTVEVTAPCSAQISCNGVTVTLLGTPDRDFPKLPIGGADSSEVATVNAATLREMFGAVEHAVCQDQTRFHLAGILFWYRGTDARMVATDGHRLAKIERNLGRDGAFCTQDAGLILREKACDAMRKLLDKGETCEIGMDHGMFLCRRTDGGVTVSIFSKPVDAAFPPYEQVIPKDNRRLVTVDRAMLSGALDRAKDLCSSDRGVRLEIVGTDLAVVTEHPDKGTARETIGADFVGKLCDGFAIGVSPKYLLDALRGIEHERITIAFSHHDDPLKGYEKKNGEYTKRCELDPMLVRSVDDAGHYAPLAAPYLSVVMPMRM